MSHSSTSPCRIGSVASSNSSHSTVLVGGSLDAPSVIEARCYLRLWLTRTQVRRRLRDGRFRGSVLAGFSYRVVSEPTKRLSKPRSDGREGRLGCPPDRRYAPRRFRRRQRRSS